MGYVEKGAGSAVVFVHGMLMDYRCFMAQMDPFAAQHRALAVSLRHYYPARWDGKGTFSLSQHIADVIAFIEQLGIGPVHLVGHSRGASLALYLARSAPHLVRTLTFAEGGVGIPAFTPALPGVAEKRAAVYRAMSERLDRNDVEGALEVFVDFVAGPRGWEMTPERLRQWMRDNAATLWGATQDTWPSLRPADLSGLEMPVLLLGAQHSPPVFAHALDRIQSHLTHAERRLVPNSFHLMQLTHPAAFNAFVMDFIARHERGSAST